ncbi:MAG: hypothetical protein ACYSSI_01930 [Planctomycetota bacterium]
MAVSILYKSLLEILCPDGIWRLTNAIESTLKCHKNRLPKSHVSEDEKRYPTTLAGMREFLNVFFTRHYFQSQHSLINYMVSDEFLECLMSGKIKILDIGCGPALTSLAITDMIISIIECLKKANIWSARKVVRLTYILNDTSEVCLGSGIGMLNHYFKIRRNHVKSVVLDKIIVVPKAFPGNLFQLRRIRTNFDTYDFVAFSYVITPIIEEQGYKNLVQGIHDVENMCGVGGKILILQDRFQAKVLRRLAREMKTPFEKKQLTQRVYSSNNSNDFYTYSYYGCLYSPNQRKLNMGNRVA